MPVFKIWSRSRLKKKSVVANTILELVAKGKKKLDITGSVTVVMEEDGTEVDDDEVLMELKGTPLIFLKEGQRWIAAGMPDAYDATSVATCVTSVALGGAVPKGVSGDASLSGELCNESTVQNQDDGSSANDSISPLPLPQFSPTVLFHLENGTCENVWEKMISEAGDFYMHSSTPDLHQTYQYQLVGKMMYTRYPAIGQSGPHPWSRFTSNLSRRMRHVRWKRKKKGSLCNVLLPKSRHQFLQPHDVNPPTNESVTYEVEPMVYNDQMENDLRKQITKFETQDECNE
ncbi:uncharacterized protein LOC117108705 [Anneissia japonica]|uniref:uncharacterized protein LOC117108705 n=1 Tax=Anneissia japonica TaxID=1529436 RepID=UPI0014258FBE|nr:uncharacterized protein LOC117108705 [Anneissia japonica]